MPRTLQPILDFNLMRPLTLRFKEPATETAYLKATRTLRNTQVRFAVFLVGLLYLTFAVMDYFVLPSAIQGWASNIHLSQGLLFCIAVIISFRVKSEKALNISVFFANAIAWGNHFVVTFGGETTILFPEVYFMLLWTWVASGFSITRSAKFNLFFLILFELVVYQFSNFSLDEMFTHRLFIMVSITLGALGGYMVEYYKRQSFISYLETNIAKQHAEEAIEVKDKFFSIISHDLRGPLGSTSSILNNVVERASDIDEELFQIIRISTKNTYELLENLLSWARSQKGEIEYHPQDFSVQQSVQSNIILFAGTAKQKNIQLNEVLNPDLYVYADIDMVTAILRNLINNAIKFTHPEGRITISSQEQGDRLRINVTDNGIGISEKTQASLFHVDQKVRSGMGTMSESGSGLGLLLCAEFVRRHGCEIGVESQTGKGSCFWFTLPIGKASESSSHAIKQKLLGQLSKIRVLLVDDSTLHLESSSAVLNQLGLSYETAFDGAEGVDKMNHGHFDLILMDIDMPIMNGIEATKIIREMTGKAPLILALTSYSKKDLEGFTEDQIFDGYLNKLLEKEKLLVTLHPILVDS